VGQPLPPDGVRVPSAKRPIDLDEQRAIALAAGALQLEAKNAARKIDSATIAYSRFANRI